MGAFITTSTLLFACYPLTRLHVFISLITFLFGALCFMFAVVGISYAYENPLGLFKSIIIILPVGTICVMMNNYIIAKVNNMLIEEIFVKLQAKEEYKFVMNKLVNSIIVVQDG